MLFLYIALNIALEPDYLYSTGIELDLIDNIKTKKIKGRESGIKLII